MFSTITNVPVPLEVAPAPASSAKTAPSPPLNGVNDKIAVTRVEHHEAKRFLIPQGCAQTRLFPGVSVERISSLEELLNKAFQTNWKELVQKSLPEWKTNKMEMRIPVHMSA